MSFSWSTTPRPIVALAPMAGVTDASYRRLIKKIAPETIVFTEFLSTDAICYGAQKTMDMLAFDPAIEKPFIVQVFGADPEHFLKACKIIEQMGANGIDINMGCPAAKVVSSCYGSALIRKPDLAAEVVHSAVKAVSIPVSVKTRLGWDTHETLIPFCKKLVEAGASALSIHGRRYHDKFTGKADWEPIYALKKEVNVPVIGNGDIASVDDAVAKIGNLDGVMVGRGTFGNPWLMSEVVAALRAREKFQVSSLQVSGLSSLQKNLKIETCPPGPMSVRTGKSETSPQTFLEKIPVILEHCELAISLKGERRGILEMRRHLSSYVKGFDGAKEVRMRLLKTEKFDEVKAILSQCHSV